VRVASAQRQALDEATAFERYAIDATIPKQADAASTMSIDLRGTETGGRIAAEGGATTRVFVGLSANLGASAVVNLMDALRPLIFGAAFKTFDLTLELALETAGLSPRRDNWTIAEKVREAQSGAGSVGPITTRFPAGWRRLCLLYSAWEETRHSLVHRTASVDPQTGALTGHDRSGQSLPPIMATEQEQFARLAVDVCDAVIDNALSLRDRKRMAWRLNQLRRHHQQASLHATMHPNVPVTVIADLEQLPDGRVRLDARTALSRARAVFSQADAFNGIFHLSGGEQSAFACNLEEVPDEALFAPSTPPAWLRGHSGK
jgi:hypothetical protein